MSKIDDSRINIFLRDYRSAAFARLFANFKTGYQEAAIQRRLLSTQNEPAFNVFKILGVSRYEAKTHTPFLRALLDPRGPHQQKELFLKSFLVGCGRLHSVPADSSTEKHSTPFPQIEVPLNPDSWESWNVKSEDPIEQGRLDIVLRSPELLCVIENKIGADEGPDQLKRYWTWMKKEQKKVGYAQVALIYLTPNGDRARTGDGVTYFRVSYREDIYLWLQNLREDTKSSPHVRTAIDQYLQIVREITGVSMEDEDVVTRHILRPENLAIALDLERQVAELRTLNHEAFWQLLSQALSARLSNSEFASDYELSAPILANYRKEWLGCFISPRRETIAPEIHLLSIQIVQNQPRWGCWLFLGVSGEGIGAKHQSLKVRELARHLEERHGFNTDWWVANKGLNYSATGDRFLMKMIPDRQTFVQDMADTMWKVFVTVEPRLRAANEDLLRGV